MTTQVRSPRGAQSCIIDARILAHTVDELQPGGSTMRHCALLFAVVSLCLPLTVYSQTRTPEAALNHYNNANKKTGKGDLDGAIEEYTRAIRLSSHLDGSNTSNRRLGNSFDDYSSEGITVIDPFTANAYNNRCLVRYKKKDLKGAVEDCDQALRIRPGLASAYLNRAAALRELGEQESALKDLDRAISIDKDFYEAFSNRGSLKLDLDDFNGALADLNRSIELNDRIAASYYHRGYTYIELKKFDLAVADFGRAVRLEPRLAWAYQGRGTALMQTGKMDQAVADFSRAIELDPQLCWAYYNRGLARVYLGNESEAQKDFDEFLKLRPDEKAQLDAKIDLARELREQQKPLQ
jgi:tetratricopeptide (TPR) repeat protein